jgi:signal transduction histidine kinase
VDAALPHVSVDNGLITRVFYNLIDNALKFTPESGLITIEAQTNENELLVTITDTGPGIPLKYREDVFRRFSQVPNQRGRRRGTGLGLTFCKLAVEAHGGRIWVESGPAGVGARFQFTLPLAAQEELI